MKRIKSEKEADYDIIKLYLKGGFMKDLLKTNVYDISDNIIIVGSCLPQMQPKAFEKLKNMSNHIYDICLESTHLNMAITKIIGMLSRVKVKKVIFATVDKSPHCIQVHYIENEIKKAMDLSNIEIIHYICVNNELIEISNDTINKSKSLLKIQTEDNMQVI